ncbi:hypothetical protein ACOSQ3_004738 [Xanthoceras sorbifolium]
MVFHAQEELHSNKWYLDSGCSNHMCGNKSLFSYLDESFKDNVKLGNNSRISVMGQGTIRLQVKDYYTIVIQKGSCSIQHPEKGIIVQHFCYGHLNFNGLRTLQQKSMVSGLPQLSSPFKVCQDCIVGKQRRDSFPIGKAWRAKQPLQLIQ